MVAVTGECIFGGTNKECKSFAFVYFGADRVLLNCCKRCCLLLDMLPLTPRHITSCDNLPHWIDTGCALIYCAYRICRGNRMGGVGTFMQPYFYRLRLTCLLVVLVSLILEPYAVMAETPARADKTKAPNVLMLDVIEVGGDGGEQQPNGLEKLNTPALGVSVEADQIEAVNTVNAEDTIRYAPNLIVRKRYIGDANATLSFRNTHTTQTPRALVTVDGFLISDFLGAGYDTAPKWAVLGPDDIERAEIIYGPTSARYSGNSLGGVLRLETRDITERAAHINVQTFVQNFDYYATNERLLGYAVDGQVDLPLGDAGGIALAYRHFDNDGQPQQWRTASENSPFVDQATVDNGLGFPMRIAAQDSVVDSSEDNFRLHGKVRLNNNWTARGLAALLLDRDGMQRPKSFLRDDKGLPTFVGIPGVTRGISESTELLTGLGLAGELAGWHTDLAISHFALLDGRDRQSNSVDVDTGIIPDAGLVTDNDARWSDVELIAERGFGRHGIATGLSYANYHGKARTSITDDYIQASNLVRRNASGGQTALFGMFVEDAIALPARFELTLGLRYERWRASGGFLVDGSTDVRYPARTRDAFSPKAALAFKPDALTKIVFSVAQATRFPTIGELYQASLISFGPNVGDIDLNGFNPDLDPERGVDFQLTGSRSFGKVSVTLSGYRQKVRNTLFSQTLLVPDSIGSQATVSESLVTNIGVVDSWGADIIVTASDLFIEGLDFDGNVSWNDPKITKNDLNPDLVGNRFPRVPKWRGNVSLRYAATQYLDVATNLRYQNTPERNLENTSNSRCETFFCVSAFSFVDIKTTWHLKSVDLDFGVDNVFDENAFVFHPYPGRTFVAGLRWTGDF